MNKPILKRGVTLIELIVVLVIVSILSTIAVGIYTKEVLRAKIARTRAEIRTLEVAINRYQIDVGQFPPGSSGTQLSPVFQANPFAGSGYLHVALRSSLSGNANAPLATTWAGPYIDWDENRTARTDGGTIGAGTIPSEISYLDPFGNPYYYINSDEYATLGGTLLPATSPFAATETYYNPSTVQIISFGPDGMTNTAVGAFGTGPDDITNWESNAF